jgi:hypothetical protein
MIIIKAKIGAMVFTIVSDDDSATPVPAQTPQGNPTLDAG